MTPRGVRNANPGNVRRTDTVWQGQSDVQADPDFVQFKTPEYGIRAIAKILTTYKSLGTRSVAGVIARWAPQSENDTQAYINAVCASCSVGADEQIDIETIMPALVKAIIQHENGEQPYTDEQINAGIALAGVTMSQPPMTPIPVTDAPKAGWAPTPSTYGSSAGGALAVVLCGLAASFNHPLDATTAAALATVCSAGVGYFLSGGRK